MRWNKVFFLYINDQKTSSKKKTNPERGIVQKLTRSYQKPKEGKLASTRNRYISSNINLKKIQNPNSLQRTSAKRMPTSQFRCSLQNCAVFHYTLEKKMYYCSS